MAFEARILAAVAAGGALGAMARYAVDAWITKGVFPLSTLVVNVVGSFVLGFVIFLDLARGGMSAPTRAFVAIGVLGAFTTMSTFAYETTALANDGAFSRATWNVVANVGLSLLAVALGRILALGVAERLT